MIILPRIYFKSTVNLLKKHYSEQTVRKCHIGYGKFYIRAVFNFIRKSERTAYYKSNIRCSPQPLLRKASSLGEGALGMTGKFPVSPEAPSQRGLSAQQTGGVSDSVFTAHPGWRYTHPWKRNGRGCAHPSDGWWKGLWEHTVPPTGSGGWQCRAAPASPAG